MYAVIKTGGKQYRVKPGDLLVVEKLDGASGDKVAFDQVLMLGEGDAVVVGAPIVAGAVVDATLIETRKGDKIKVFKKIRRQGYRRTQGHRQFESVLRVTGIAGEGQSETWDGAVDLTPRSVLNARARGFKPDIVEAAPVAAETPAAKVKKEAKAPAAEVEAPEVVASDVEAAPATTEAKVKPAAKAKAAKPAAEAAPVADEAAAAPKAKKVAKPKTDEA